MTWAQLGGRDVVAVGLAIAVALAFLASRSMLVATAALLVAIFLILVVTKAEWVLLLLIASQPWEAMLHYPTETLSLVKLLGFAVLAAYLFRRETWTKAVRTSPVAACAVLFGLVALAALVVSPVPATGFVKGFRYAFFIVFLLLVVQLVDTNEAGKRVLRVYCASAAAAGAYGLYSFLTGAVSRAAGPILDPNDFGFLLATAVPAGIYLYTASKNHRWFWVVCVLTLLAGTFSTLSRGALVGLSALLLWAIITRRINAKRMGMLLVGVLAVVIIAFAVAGPVIEEHLEQKSRIANENVESRESFWEAAFRMSLDHPVLGIGLGRFGEEAPNYVRTNPEALEDPVVHDSYLEILAEAGPIALALFLSMLIGAWIAASRGESVSLVADDQDGAHFAAALKGMLIVGLFSGIFLSEQVAVPFWLICGLAGSGALPRPSAFRVPAATRFLGAPRGAR